MFIQKRENLCELGVFLNHLVKASFTHHISECVFEIAVSESLSLPLENA